jgi:hypothetical protein
MALLHKLSIHIRSHCDGSERSLPAGTKPGRHGIESTLAERLARLHRTGSNLVDL